MGSSSLTRDQTPGPLHREHGVFATGPPGKSPQLLLNALLFCVPKRKGRCLEAFTNPVVLERRPSGSAILIMSCKLSSGSSDVPPIPTFRGWEVQIKYWKQQVLPFLLRLLNESFSHLVFMPQTKAAAAAEDLFLCTLGGGPLPGISTCSRATGS